MLFHCRAIHMTINWWIKWVFGHTGVSPVDGAQVDGETIDTKTKSTEIDTSTTGAVTEEVDNDEIIGKMLDFCCDLFLIL